MLVYLMRHARAEVGQGVDDLSRPLSPEGRAYVRRLLPRLRALGVRPEQIVSSPYQRALQTARLVADGLGYSQEILKDEALSPMGSTAGVQALLIAFAECQQVLFVGHAPSMPAWIGELCGSSAFRIAFPAGAICCIELPEPRRWSGTLRWLITHVEAET
ncbi:MAG: phosphohistidine phosphatase SixA [Candidatus Kapabacteria bacterium]|nr:phosphohistidine phosphatase SixA [Candidatus Kapabacteria bacterium]MDW8012282.1 phosphohistidine phosphatase SixA [Bacteroidota bacterium]